VGRERPAGARYGWYLTVRALDEDFLTDDVASNAFETFAVAVTSLSRLERSASRCCAT